MSGEVPWLRIGLLLVGWSVAAFFVFVPILYILGVDAVIVLLAAAREIYLSRKPGAEPGPDHGQ